MYMAHFVYPFICNGLFHLLAFVSNAAINIGFQIPLQVSVFHSLGLIPRSGISGSYAVSNFWFRFCLRFERLPHYVPQWLNHFPFPPAMFGDFRFCLSSPTLVVLHSHGGRCEVVSHFDFDLYFPKA